MRRFAPASLLVATLALAACAARSPAPADAAMVDTRVKAAVATLSPAASGGALGVVTFSQGGNTVDVHVLATGLVPGSVHGFHVHENGNCASADFMSAGGHFNPGHQPHGPQAGPHHAGDMPSLLADPTGKIDFAFTLNNVSLGGPDGYVGHAVILHSGPDDFTTQPTGNSGGRIACGVISAI